MLIHPKSISVESLNVSSYTIPADLPESDGTIEWDHATIIIVETGAAGQRGIGYTYAANATATLIHDLLASVLGHGRRLYSSDPRG